MSEQERAISVRAAVERGFVLTAQEGTWLLAELDRVTAERNRWYAKLDDLAKAEAALAREREKTAALTTAIQAVAEALRKRGQPHSATALLADAGLDKWPASSERVSL